MGVKIYQPAKLFSIGLSGILVVLLWRVPMVQASSFTVNTTNDTVDHTIGDGICADAAGQCSLRAALQEADTIAAHNTITLPANTYTLTLANSSGDEDSAATGDLDILYNHGNITINGAGQTTTIITAAGLDRVLEVLPNAALILKNLTVEGGALTTASGAGIATAGRLTLNHVTVTDNTISGDPGHGTEYDGIGIDCAAGSVSLTDSTLSYNTFGDGVNIINGGGLYTHSDCTAVSLTRTTVTHNDADYGGGVYLTEGIANAITLKDVEFSNNTSNTDGAGVFVNGAEADQTAQFNRLTLRDNQAGSSAGGIFVNGPLNITNATFYNNSADPQAGVGGGLYANPFDHSIISIAFSTFTHNSAAAGTAIYYDGENQDVHIHGSVIADNGGYEECYNNLYSTDYNYIASTVDCTINVQAHDQLDTTPPSYMDTLVPSDHGGSVETLAFQGSEVRNLVPATDCVDAAGALLTTDARGVPRPQASNCDIGAYELDQTAPVLTIIGNTHTAECKGIYSDDGATASDDFSLAGNVTTTNPVNTNLLGNYTVSYAATDVDGNSGTTSRTITVQDTTAPVITLVGAATMYVEQGTIYNDAGATATDTCYGDVTADITVNNPVDTTTSGMYQVSYTVTDIANNVASQVTRTVVVTAGTPQVTTNGKYITVNVNGTVVSQAKIADKIIVDKYRLLKVNKLYPEESYSTVAYLVVNQSEAKLIIFRLNDSNVLVQKVERRFAIQRRNHLALRLQVDTHQITVRVGSGAASVQRTYTLTRQGDLKLIN